MKLINSISIVIIIFLSGCSVSAVRDSGYGETDVYYDTVSMVSYNKSEREFLFRLVKYEDENIIPSNPGVRLLVKVNIGKGEKFVKTLVIVDEYMQNKLYHNLTVAKYDYSDLNLSKGSNQEILETEILNKVYSKNRIIDIDMSLYEVNGCQYIAYKEYGHIKIYRVSAPPLSESPIIKIYRWPDVVLVYTLAGVADVVLMPFYIIGYTILAVGM